MESIQKQFELPERQSKIACLFPTSEAVSKDGSSTLYCICRSNDCTRFMIACDACEEWYHGDCINITERQAENIKRFYCDMCRARDPQLHVRYRHRVSSSRHRERSVGGSRHTAGQTVQDRSQSHHPSHSRSYVLVDGRYAPSGSGCGRCDNCLRVDECGVCGRCRDMPAFGGSGARGLPCRRRVCLVQRTAHSSEAGSRDGLSRGGQAEECDSPAQRQTHSTPGSRAVHQDSTHAWADDVPVGKTRPFSDKRKRHRPSPTSSSMDSPRRPYHHSRTHQLHRHRYMKTQQPRRRHSTAPSAKKVGAHQKADVARQCHGPQCVYAARANSDYCSNTCGLNLARNRIFQVLPQRLQEWNQQRCVAEIHNTRTLERVRGQLVEAQARLQRLSKQHARLDRVVERARRLTVDRSLCEEERGVEGGGEETTAVYCVTCGHEVGSRQALRHMYKCYAKHEAQTSFGSHFQTHIEGFNMFCDLYNRSTNTYCKRLRVLCPEHSKAPKVSDNEVCGCPLVDKKFDLNGQVCRAPKKKCVKHLNWERLRRADIDMERVRCAMRIDELMEQERQCRQSLANRAGVLSLMLHSTFNHETSMIGDGSHQINKSRSFSRPER